MYRYIYFLFVAASLWSCQSTNDPTGPGLLNGEQITLNLTDLSLTCPNPSEGCMEVFKDRMKFLSHDGSETEAPDRDPMFTCVDCNPDLIIRCAEPPPGGDGSMDGGALIEVLTRPRIKQTLNSGGLKSNIAFTYTQKDLHYREAYPEDNINHEFISFAAIKTNYDSLVNEVYKRAVIYDDRDIIPDPTIEFFYVE